MILDCNEIIEHRLWVGRFVRHEEVKFLQQMGITAVLSLQSDDDLSWYGIPEKKLLKAYANAGIACQRVPVPDFNRETLAQHISECAEAIHLALTPRWACIYVHCTAGVNRAPTAAAAYLMLTRAISAEDAFNYVTERRHCGPFLDVLQHYEILLKESRMSSQDSL